MRTCGGATRKSNALLWLLAVSLGFLLVACDGGGVPASVSRAVDESISGIQTVRLAGAMDSSGKLTGAAASTAVDDALRELGKARTTVVQLSPTTQDARDLRGAALAAMDDCNSAVVATAEALTREDGRPAVTETNARWESAAAALSTLKKRLGGP